MNKPNILYIMTDQQRFDTIHALGNSKIHTPNMDRLVKNGVTFKNAYSPCPVCVPARYTIRTGCDSPTTLAFKNNVADATGSLGKTMTERCGKYLGQVMQDLGYRTFGIGKFHSTPWDEDLGYDVHLHTEELYNDKDQRERDSYAKFIREEHPSFDFVENLMGERTEMYYQPQMSPLPAPINVENFVAEKTIEQIEIKSEKPFFGFVSFVGPHPPLAPPIPFNRMYHPDNMDGPIQTNIELDHLDEQITNMNHMVFAEEWTNLQVKVLKSRYYGEITYIDHCLGKILDCLDKNNLSNDTMIVFFSDHGDHFADHHAWQKESFFEQAMRIPFIISAPSLLPSNEIKEELVSLTDLVAIATKAGGEMQTREGIDVLGLIDQTAEPRKYLFGYYGFPGTQQFKMMVRDNKWKYIYLPNGGYELLFDLENDPNETENKFDAKPELSKKFYNLLLNECKQKEFLQAAIDGDKIIKYPFKKRPVKRIYQMDLSRGVHGFPEHPQDLIKSYKGKL